MLMFLLVRRRQTGSIRADLAATSTAQRDSFLPAWGASMDLCMANRESCCLLQSGSWFRCWFQCSTPYNNINIWAKTPSMGLHLFPDFFWLHAFQIRAYYHTNEILSCGLSLAFPCNSRADLQINIILLILASNWWVYTQSIVYQSTWQCQL